MAMYGINDQKYPSRQPDGKTKKEYNLWCAMLHRCYSKRFHSQDNNYVYIGCTVSEAFRNYSLFYEWCQTQVGFGEEGFCLDKDILSNGVKEYSEQNCVFVPQEINKLLNKHKIHRGEYPIGVSKYKNKRFMAGFSGNGIKNNCLGYFDTSEEAFAAYKTAKEQYIKTVAEKWKHKIDPRVYQAMLNYQVNVTD